MLETVIFKTLLFVSTFQKKKKEEQRKRQREKEKERLERKKKEGTLLTPQQKGK